MSAIGETLGWEAQQRPRAVATALLGGVLTLAGNVLFTLLVNGTPTEDEGFISLTEALGSRLAGSPPAGESLIVRQVEYYGDNAVPLILAAVLNAGAAICAALVLLYLYRATLARNPNVGRIPLFATVTALVMFPVGHLVRQIASWSGAADFRGEVDKTAETAREVFAQGTVVAGQLFEVLGSFALALAFALVGLNAMRVGLLTRFLGILAIIAGVLTVFQLDQPGVIRAFWLFAVGLLLAGRTRSGLPPAWQTGRSEPWPSQQQIREQRAAAAEPPADEAPESAGQRRKRKRRR